LEAAYSPFNGNLHDFLHQRIISQLRVRDMMRASPYVHDGDVNGLFNPFLLRRELRIPA
jgi:hypothetical protein